MLVLSCLPAWTVVAGFISTACAADQKPIGPDGGSETGNPFNDDFSKLAEETLDNWKVPGLAIAVIDDEDVYAEGYGFASFPDTPATPETIWYGASTSKAQLAAVLSHLIVNEQYPALANGWTTTISSVLRDDFVLQDEWSTTHLTLDDAVSHRTGMPRHDRSTMREIDGRPARPRGIVRNLRNLALTYPPRVTFKYCNLMFITLSHVVETVTGKWLGDVLRETLWQPLGMNSTYFDLDDALAAPGHFASGYRWDSKAKKYNEVPKMPLTEISGAGSVLSTVLDYAKWVKCLLHESEPLSAATHRDLKTPRMMSSTAPFGGLDVQLYSLGWERTLFRGHVVYTHSGGMHAYGAEVYWLPEHKYGVVSFANTALTSNAAEEVLCWRLIQDKLGIPKKEQFDFNAKWRTILDGQVNKTRNALDIVYPDRPEKALPPTANTSSCAGTYHNAGYGTINLREEPHPDSDTAMLVADRPDSTWQYKIQLEHVTGDYWMAYTKITDDEDSFFDDFAKGWFVIGVDGKVAALNISWQTQLGDMDEGTSSFERVDD